MRRLYPIPRVRSIFGAFTAVFLLSACATHRADYQHQIQVCDVAETNGVLERAVEACASALEIADSHKDATLDTQQLTLRLARLQRESGQFAVAEALTRRSLQLTSGDSTALACRQIELALNLAGQQRWPEAAEEIAKAANDLADLSPRDVTTATRAATVIAARLPSDSPKLAALRNLQSTAGGSGLVECNGRPQ